MKRSVFSVKNDRQTFVFELAEYLHHEGDRCRLELFKENKLVLGLEPDRHEYLRVCKNPGNIDEALVSLIIDKLESYHL